MRILQYNGFFYPGHEKRDLNLVNELRRQGHDVVYAVMSDKAKNNPYPGYPIHYRDDPDFRQADAFWIDDILDLFKLIDQVGLVLIGVEKGAGLFVDYARKTGKNIVQHQDIGSIAISNYQCDLYCVRGEWSKRRMMKYRSTPEEKLRVTGCIQFDAASPNKFRHTTREKFCSKYSLDPSKKIAVWLTASPVHHNVRYRQLYKKVIHAIKKTDNFQVIIKGHPLDYAAHKRSLRYGDVDKPSWEILAPDIRACDLEDGYTCYHFADVGISVLSTVSMEFPLVKKPFIYVNRQEHLLPHEIADIVKLPIQAARKASLREYDVHENVMKIARHCVQMPTSHTNREIFENGEIEYIGLDCTIDELKDVLLHEKYVFSDDSAYDTYVRKYCFANDGKSYKRIADAVSEFVGRKEYKYSFSHRLTGSISKSAYRLRWNSQLRKIVDRLRAVI